MKNALLAGLITILVLACGLPGCGGGGGGADGAPGGGGTVTGSGDGTPAGSGSISVTVKNMSGASVAGAVVQAYQGGAPSGNSAATDANGVATLRNLGAGSYDLRTTYFAYSATGSPVNVAAGQTVAAPAVSLPFTAAEVGAVNITFRDGQSSPIANAPVTAVPTDLQVGAAEGLWHRVFLPGKVYAADAPFTLTALTGSDGTAHFANLPPGAYIFTAVYARTSMTSPSVLVSAGGVEEQVVAAAPDSGSITATVKGSGSGVIGGSMVTLRNGAGIVATLVTDAAGTASFSGCAPGEYTITAHKDNYVDKSMPVSVASGQTTSIDITLVTSLPTGSVTVNLGGSEIAETGDYTVAIMDSTQQRHTATVSRSNSPATVNDIPTGRCKVIVTGPNGYHAEAYPLGFTMLEGRNVGVNVTSFTRDSMRAIFFNNDTVNPVYVQIYLDGSYVGTGWVDPWSSMSDPSTEFHATGRYEFRAYWPNLDDARGVSPNTYYYNGGAISLTVDVN